MPVLHQFINIMKAVQGADYHVGKTVKKYYFEKVLGRGSFGSVYLVHESTTKTQAACKVINKKKISQIPKLGQLINSQINVLYLCKDKSNIVNYFEAFQDEQYVYIVMEFCNQGDLEDYIKAKGGRIFEEEAKHFLKEIVNGFRTIRNIDAIHRDFKLDNVLINNGVAKIADLGFSKILPEQQDTVTVLGTLYTMAPEVLAKKPYGYQCDIWSLGTVYYKLLFGTYPYMGRNYAQMLKLIRSKQPDFHASVNLSKESKDFILRCLVVDPNKRITWEEIYSHPIVSGFAQTLDKITIPNNILRIQQFYIRNCPFFRITNSFPYPDATLSAAINEQRSKNPVEKIQRINSYYQLLYLSIRQYILERFRYVVDVIERFIILNELKNRISLELHSAVGYVISRQSFRQLSQLINNMSNKANILNLTHLVNEFFNSQEYKSLIDLLKKDQSLVLQSIFKFKNTMNRDSLLKLQPTQNTAEKIVQRERRHLIIYGIEIFNNLENVDKRTIREIFSIISFIQNTIQCKYKSPAHYTSFALIENLKPIWEESKEKLSKLKSTYQ